MSKEGSKSEEVKPGDEVLKSEVSDAPPKAKRLRKGYPKYPKETWIRIKEDFVLGKYTSLEELSARYKVNSATLRSRMTSERWNDQVKAIESTLQSKVEETRLNQVEEYLQSSFKRAKKYEKIIDATLSQYGTNAEGTPTVEPGDLDALTRSENRIHELAKSALRIAPISQVDVTSKGQSLGESFAQAIQKLREEPGKKLSADDVSRVLDCDIVE